MNELVRLGNAYQEMDKKRLSLYKSALDTHQKALSPFIINPDPKLGVQAGIFRIRFDQLYEKAKALGLLREASPQDLPQDFSMAEVATTVTQYDEKIGRYYSSLGDWANKQEGLGNKLFFVEAQRQSMDQIKKELAQLFTDWENAREEFFKKMAKDPYKETFAEIDKIAATMEKDFGEPYRKHRGALHILATSGRFEHCLGEIKPTQTYKVTSGSDISDLLPYNPGPEGTFEGLPGVGFRVDKPAKLEPIKIPTENSIPKEFPLDLPLKYDAALHIKTEIERLKIQIKAERDGIIAIGNYLSGGLLEGWKAQALGEAFNVFHGIVEGFAGIGHLVISTSDVLLTFSSPTVGRIVDTFKLVKQTSDTAEKILTDSSLQREIVKKIIGSLAEFTIGVVHGIELLATKDTPPDNQFDAITLQEWKELADKTKRAREALTTCERLAGQVLSDILTGMITSYGTKAQKLAKEALDTANDLAKASQKANKLDDAARLGSKLPDDVPKPKAIQELGNEIKKHQDDVAKAIDDIVKPKPKDIPYSEKMLPSGQEILKKMSASSEAGGMNIYSKLDDNLGLKMSKEPILKSSTNVDAALKSKVNLDIDDAGRAFLKDALKDSSIGRLPEVKERIYIVGEKIYRNLDEIPNNTYYKVVDVVEHIPPQTHAAVLAQQGKLTQGHIRAYETFMRELNQKGYVWIDNKLKNFAFETIDEAKGLYRVVPLDAGGFLKVTDLPAGLSQGDMAAKIQKAFNKAFETPGNVYNQMYEFSKEANKLGIPENVYMNIENTLGLTKINKFSETLPGTFVPGQRISSPSQQAYNIYSKIENESTDVLKKQIGKAFDELVEANPKYQEALKALEGKKLELANTEKKLNDALELTEKAAKAAQSPEIPKDIDFNWLAAASQQVLTEAEKAKEMVQCASIKEKILSGIVSDWIKEAWKKCKELGFTFEAAK
ncbi:MAG: hypothetical protein N3D15_03710 [Syntrophorhabdaceae bacterium]|nr:hypothetical protein [Syntrophorhabdaceae bacterium]